MAESTLLRIYLERKRTNSPQRNTALEQPSPSLTQEAGNDGLGMRRVHSIRGAKTRFMWQRLVPSITRSGSQITTAVKHLSREGGVNKEAPPGSRLELRTLTMDSDRHFHS